MEILKKALMAASAGMLTISALAQNDVALQTAFKQSYTSEYQTKYVKAIEDLTPVYSTSSYELNLRMGWLNYMAKKFIESAGYYEKAIAIMPMSIEAKLGSIYPLAALEKWDKVEDTYKNILKTESNNATVNYRLALLLYNKGEFGQSKVYVEKYINLYPFDYDGVSLAGWISLKSGKGPEARALFNRALLIRPDDASVKSGLASIK